MAPNMNSMATDVREVLERYHVHYEVRPYYAVLDERPAGAPRIEQRVQAGFDVNLYGTLEKEQMPDFDSKEAREIVRYFESRAREIQSQAGQRCTVEVIPCPDSIVLDTRQHFQPEAMLQIRISHDRGLEQAEGPSEEEALQAVRETLHELGVREG
jgi:hypothetical protein